MPATVTVWPEPEWPRSTSAATTAAAAQRPWTVTRWGYTASTGPAMPSLQSTTRTPPRTVPACGVVMAGHIAPVDECRGSVLPALDGPGGWAYRPRHGV